MTNQYPVEKELQQVRRLDRAIQEKILELTDTWVAVEWGSAAEQQLAQQIDDLNRAWSNIVRKENDLAVLEFEGWLKKAGIPVGEEEN